ncbi:MULTISPECIES: shikimate dehydrogenase [Methanosarcina]|uniref:Shikimate dehydrogenase (NADP(+)) n=3 Tax=Methanosarcina barkeri TaxID=2208 RepID=A0A0E3QPD1_METBA|nr:MULTISPECIES: shikimate dehydrogenase [Methanosarcina]AKB53070.1 Shikimate 5-dehydrogenase I alpha [Methanosarcina barkeri MS]AKB58824.1 Shikimate 5-dehydrogenase I alpha [Methanosarcina barkeri 227]AKJ38480.1 shikimate 5-dehydrogenase AroE [Methanosarcina barkeri CM1]OED04215.1 shikimate dehydrogenase [Methanosarcina sp. A14]
MKRVFGVFGDPIAHSLSPAMHNAAFSALGMECIYHAFRVKPEKLEKAILGAEAMGFGGLNLTVPLKEVALKLDCIKPDSLAEKIGAVNTVVFGETGEIKGYNTDGLGAKQALQNSAVEIKGSKIVVAGAGGAARSIAFQLAADGAEITIVNRTEGRAIELAKDISAAALSGSVTGRGFSGLKDLLQDANILINTTTLGMHPNVDTAIATAEDLHPDLTVFDIVYNPLETRLLREAKTSGAKTVSGVLMLVYQGAEAFRLWTGIEPPVELMKKTVLEALQA